MCPSDDRDSTEPLPDDGRSRKDGQKGRLEKLRADETWPEETRPEDSGEATRPLDPEATWPETDLPDDTHTEALIHEDEKETVRPEDLLGEFETDPTDEVDTLRAEEIDPTTISPRGTRGIQGTPVPQQDAGTDSREATDATSPTTPDVPLEPASRTSSSVGSERTRATTAHGQGPKAPGARKEGPPVRVFAGRFEVEDVLGEGGMGKVFRVRDRQIEGRQVALKVLRPKYSRSESFRDLFFKEIHAAQNFVSEHVNQVRDTGQMEDGQLFLTMDLVPGESLSALLKREGALSSAHALEITRQILLGLQSGHEKGFVHRDVKPGNVMLRSGVARTEENPFGVGVQLLDFGIASLAASLKEGATAGTPRYMSPEQVQGERLDPRSDLFAVGVVLFRLLCGKLPFEGTTLEEVKTSILEVNLGPQIEHLESVPDPVRKILRKSLRKDRAKRFQSAAEFAKAIERLQEKAESRGTSRLAAALIVLFAGAAASLGVLYSDQMQELKTAESKVESLRGDQELALAAMEQRLADKDRLIGELFTVDAVTQRSNQAIDRWQDENDWDKKHSFYEDWYEDIEGGLESSRLPNRMRHVEDELARVTTEILDLRRRNNNLESLASPTVRQADGFERVLTFLEVRQAEYADNQFAELEREFLFDRMSGTGGALLVSLIIAAKEIQRLEGLVSGSNSSIAEGLGEVETFLDEAENQLVALARVDPPWLTVVVDVNENADPDPQELSNRRLSSVEARIQDLRLQAEQLEVKGQEKEAELGQTIVERWTELTSRPPESDPTELIAFAREHDQDLEPSARRYLAHLQQGPLTAELFPLEALRQEPALEVWGKELEGSTSALGTSKTGLELRLVWAALRWYQKKVKPAELERELALVQTIVPPPARAEAHHDWRIQFTLQAAAMVRQPVWLTDGWESVYRHRFTDGTVWWWKQEGRFRGAGRWDVKREHYLPGKDRTPNREDPVPVQLTEAGELFIGADERLDAYQISDDVRIGLWEPELDTPPDGSWWARGLDFEKFASETQVEPLVCLIVETDRHTSWFSPRFGLVREITKSKYPAERELAFRATSR